MTEQRPLVVLLHALGLSGRSWDGVVAALGDGYECLAIDLPGFGANAHSDRLTVEQTAAWVADRVAARAPDRWLLVGHSMGGKIAAVLTAWSEVGEHGLTAPDGVVLVEPSPPSPEPISEDRRAAMVGWAASGPVSRAHAADYIAAAAPAAPDPVRALAIDDVLRSDRVAWLGWLERGSLEDWRASVGLLRTPVDVVVGDEDGDLGGRAQRRESLPHWRTAELHDLGGAGHFLVLERPDAVARVIAARWDSSPEPAAPPAFLRLIASDRVSAKTRRVMLARLDPTGDGPAALSPAQRALLTALLDRLLPQPGTDIDLAARIDAELAAGRGDGWRFGDLPPDADAWRAGLDTVAALAGDFAALDGDGQDDWVGRFSSGDAGSDGPGRLDGHRMALWFQDVRAEAVRVWLSHPAAQAWIRYDGFADGGDGERKQGYLRTHAGEHEPWQRDWRTGEEWPWT